MNVCVASTFFFWILITSVCSQNDCENYFCFKIVREAHQQLRGLLEKGRNITRNGKYPSILNPENLENLIDRIKIIENKLKKQNSHLDKNVDDLEEAFKNITFSEDKLKNVPIPQPDDDLDKSLEEINKIIELIRNRIKTFEGIISKNQETFKICDEAKTKALDFIDKGSNLLREFNTFINGINSIKLRKTKITSDLDKVMTESKDNLNMFNNLQIPENLAKNYLNNPNITGFIINLENNKHELETLIKNLLSKINEDFHNAMDKINEAINKLLDEAKEIRRIIEDNIKKLPQIQPLPIDEINSLIDKVRKGLEDLDERIGKFNFKDLEEELLKNKQSLLNQVNKFARQLIEEENKIKDNELFLKVLIEILEKDAEKVRREIEKTKLTIKLVHEKEQLEADLTEIKSIYNELVRYRKDEICSKLSVDFET